MLEEMVPKTLFDLTLNLIDFMQRELKACQEKNCELEAVIREKNQTILNLTRAQFGQTSEKETYVMGDDQPDQDDLPDENTVNPAAAPEAELKAEPGIEPEDELEDETEETITIPEHTRRLKRKQEEIWADLPVEEIICDLAESERFNENGQPLKCIGKDLVRSYANRKQKSG